MNTETRLTLGERLESKITLRVGDTLTDPGSITLFYRRAIDPTTEVVVAVPDPLNPVAPVERLSQGVYRAMLDLDESGDWRVRWETTAPAKSAIESRIRVLTIYPTD